MSELRNAKVSGFQLRCHSVAFAAFALEQPIELCRLPRRIPLSGDIIGVTSSCRVYAGMTCKATVHAAQVAIAEACQQGWIVQAKGRYRLPLCLPGSLWPDRASANPPAGPEAGASRASASEYPTRRWPWCFAGARSRRKRCPTSPRRSHDFDLSSYPDPTLPIADYRLP